MLRAVHGARAHSQNLFAASFCVHCSVPCQLVVCGRQAHTRQMRGDMKVKGVRRRTSVTDRMETDAEKLWSAFTRGLLKFENVPPIQGAMPNGAIGVAVGPKGDAAFLSYLKQPKVIARLEAEGFERAGWGAPYPWYLSLEPGVVSPADKAVLPLAHQRAA